MADEKITDLSDGGVLLATDELVVARSGANNKIAGNRVPGAELDYVQKTSSTAISATTAAGANTVLDGNAVSYDGSTRAKIEFYAYFMDVNIASYMIVDLWDGSTDLARIFQYHSSSGGGDGCTIYAVTFLTPSNASHTYHIKAYKTSGTGNIYADAAGFPAFMRITVA